MSLNCPAGTRVCTASALTLSLTLGCACLAPAAGARSGTPPPVPSAMPSGADDHHAGSGLAARTAERITPPLDAASVRGLDVSSHQGDVDWRAVAAKGAKFAYVKATESTGYRNPKFAQQYGGSAKAGLIRGAYHFASPARSGGARQADFFVDHGGGWSADGRTLPGALDIEYNPGGGNDCYGLGQGAMTRWIRDFVNRYKKRTGRHPAIYTTTDWWRKCTGNTAAFAANSPLWIANYGGTALPLPAGWKTYTFWQTADSGPLPGDQDVFNGSLDDLRRLARGGSPGGTPGDGHQGDVLVPSPDGQLSGPAAQPRASQATPAITARATTTPTISPIRGPAGAAAG